MVKTLKVSEPAYAKDYLPALTGIRFIASSMVFFHHFNPFSEIRYGWLMHGLLEEFHIGVTIFFVLSGFLIYYRYADSFLFEKKHFKKYFINRFARIYPMYFLITTVVFIPIISNKTLNESWVVYLLNITFLRGFFDEYKFTGAPAGWSLTVEETFYLLFPLILIISKKIRLVFQPLLFIALGLILLRIFKNISFYGFFFNFKFVFEYTFFGRCFEFFTGIYLARYLKLNIEVAGTTIKRSPIYTFAGIFYISICLMMLIFNHHYIKYEFSLFNEKLINNILLPPGIAYLLYGLIKEHSWIKNLLSHEALVLLGKSSYTFYLIHNTFIFGVFYRFLFFNPLFVFIAIQILALIIYLLIEEPFKKLFAYRPKEISISRQKSAAF